MEECYPDFTLYAFRNPKYSSAYLQHTYVKKRN